MDKNQIWIDQVTRKWWFYLIILFVSFLPAYASQPYDPRDTPKLIGEVLSNSRVGDFPVVFPFFKIIPLLLIWRLVIRGKNAARWFNGYVAFTLLIYAVFQNSAFTESYGFAVITGNLVMFLLVSIFWVWDLFAQRTQYQLGGRPLWCYWVAPVAFLAFWMPVQQTNGSFVPDFSLLGLIANQAGLAFCMMMPVYLAVATLAYPAVNLPLLRVSGWVGAIIAFYNLLQYIMLPGYGWWMAILHLPLLTISLFAFYLGLKKHEAIGG